jgi:sugar phosphate isomerase/epimerase
VAEALDKLAAYAERHGLRLHVRPARFGELHPSQDCHVLGIEKGTIQAIWRQTAQEPLLLAERGERASTKAR